MSHTVKVPTDIELMPKHKSKRTAGQKATSLSPTLEDSMELSQSVSNDDEPVPKATLDAASDIGSIETEPELSRLAKTWATVTSAVEEFVLQFTEWLEGTSALYREVTGEIKEMQAQSPDTIPTPVDPDASDEHTPLAVRHGGMYGAVETSPGPSLPLSTEAVSGQAGIEARQLTRQKKVYAEVHGGDDDQDPNSAVIKSGYTLMEDEEGRGEESADVVRRKPSPHGAAGDRPGDQRGIFFDERGDTVFEELNLVPTEGDKLGVQEYETELGEKAKAYTKPLRRLGLALYYTALAHSEYLVYFLVFLNVLLNGSIISLVYPFLLFLWGMLSIPWPSKRFWLTLIFYTMSVLLVKYGFQFHKVPWPGSPANGLYLPRIIGILHRNNFFANAAWDMLLLIALLFHRGLLKVHTCTYMQVHRVLVCLYSVEHTLGISNTCMAPSVASSPCSLSAPECCYLQWENWGYKLMTGNWVVSSGYEALRWLYM